MIALLLSESVFSSYLDILLISEGLLVLSSVSYPLNLLKLLSKFYRLIDGDKLEASEGAFKRILLVYDYMAATEFLEQSGFVS